MDKDIETIANQVILDSTLDLIVNAVSNKKYDSVDNTIITSILSKLKGQKLATILVLIDALGELMPTEALMGTSIHLENKAINRIYNA